MTVDKVEVAEKDVEEGLQEVTAGALAEILNKVVTSGVQFAEEDIVIESKTIREGLHKHSVKLVHGIPPTDLGNLSTRLSLLKWTGYDKDGNQQQNLVKVIDANDAVVFETAIT